MFDTLEINASVALILPGEESILNGVTSLTETAKVTKIGFKYIAASLVVLVFGQIALSWTINLYKTLNPPPPPAPTVGFGALPKIVFPSKDVGEITYRLETVSGAVPSFGPTVKVFPTLPKKANLLGLDRGSQRASAMGFVFEPEQISGSLYRWSNSLPLPSTLELDYAKETFDLEVSWQSDPGFLNVKLIPTEAQTITEVKNYLKRSGSLPDDMANGVVNTTYLKYNGGKLIDAVSLSEADFVRVDIYRENIDELPVLPSDPDTGVARVLVSGSKDQGKRFVNVKYRHTSIDYLNFHTYPVISGQEAWERLVGGQGFVARAAKKGKEMVIRDVYLGYYDSLDEQAYLQPIYVFSGDEGFLAYVSAVDSNFIQTE